MFRAVRSVVSSNSSALVGKKVNAVATRSIFGLFVNKNAEVKGDADQQGGRRKLEMDMAAQGISAFNRDPIVPDHDAGTKEKPIVVSAALLFNLLRHRYLKYTLLGFIW
jgi:hypothetical protein